MSEQQTYVLTLSRGLKLSIAAAALILMGVLVSLGWLVVSVDSVGPFLPFVTIAGVILVGGLVLLWMQLRPKKVVLSGYRIWMPDKTFIRAKLHEIALPELTHVYQWHTPTGACMVLVAGKKKFQLMQSYFRDEETYQSFRALLEERVSVSPGGEAILETGRRDEDVFKEWRARPMIVAYVSVALIVAVFVLEVIVGTMLPDGGAPLFMLLDMGALWLPAVASGEWGRIFMGSLLHAGFYHLLANAFGLFVFGMLAERYLGSWRVLTILLASCLGGTAMTLVFSPSQPLVGISGGVFGLAAAFVYLQWTQREALTAPHRDLHKFLFIGALGFDILLSFLLPSISLSAHLGGLIVGLAVTHLLVGSAGLNPEHRSNLVRAVAIGLAALFIAGAATSLIGFAKDDGAEVRRGWVLEQRRVAAGDRAAQYELTRAVLKEGRSLEDVGEYRELVGLAVENAQVRGASIAELDEWVRRRGRRCGLDEPEERAWVEIYRRSLPSGKLPSYLNDTAWHCATQQRASVESLEVAYQLADEALSTSLIPPRAFRILDTRARLAYRLAGRTSTDAGKSDAPQKREWLERAMADGVRAFEVGYSSEIFESSYFGAEIVEFAKACHLAGCNAPGSVGVPEGFHVEAKDTTLRIESTGAPQPMLLVALDTMSGDVGPSGLIAGCVMPGKSIEIETESEWNPAQMTWLSVVDLDVCPETLARYISTDEAVEALPD